MTRDVLKGMVAAANSFKNSPSRIPTSYPLQEESKKWGEITSCFHLKGIKKTKKAKEVKK